MRSLHGSGGKNNSLPGLTDVRFWHKADITRLINVRFGSEADIDKPREAEWENQFTAKQ